MLTMKLNGTEYTLATTLRVAYRVQEQHNHKSYTKLFSEIGEMTLEQQIDIIYAAFAVGNPDTAKTFTREMFRTYLMDSDEFNATLLMELLQGVIAGILGKDLDELKVEAEASEDATAGNAKN